MEYRTGKGGGGGGGTISAQGGQYLLADYVRGGQFPLANYVRGDKICGGTESAPTPARLTKPSNYYIRVTRIKLLPYLRHRDEIKLTA